jgi:hypothetical protein
VFGRIRSEVTSFAARFSVLTSDQPLEGFLALQIVLGVDLMDQFRPYIILRQNTRSELQYRVRSFMNFGCPYIDQIILSM